MKNKAHILDVLSTEGSIKSTFSVCLSVYASVRLSVPTSVWHLSQEWLISFCLIFGMVVDKWNI